MDCTVAIVIIHNYYKFDERNERVTGELRSFEDQLEDLSKKLTDSMSKKQVGDPII